MLLTKLKRSVFCLLIAFICAGDALAQLNDFGLGVGFVSRRPGKVQVTEGGEKNGLTDARPFLTTHIDWRFLESEGNYLSLAPEFSIETPGNTRDENISKISYWLSLPVAYRFDYRMLNLDHQISFLLGPGLSWTRISGKGGTATLPNGSGTANFPVPEGASFTQNIILLAGFGYKYKGKYSGRLEAHSFNAFDSLNRSWNYLLSFRYHFGDSLWN